MDQLFRQLTKQQLIVRLLAAEKEKNFLLQLLDLKDHKIKDLEQKTTTVCSTVCLQKTQIKQCNKNSTLFFDHSFSEGYYRIENKGSKAIWLKGSDNDYQHWPAVRTSQLITGVKQFKLNMPGYGWIGLGTQNIRNDGFPGYTTEGWMLCANGRVYHNREQTSYNGSINFQNKISAIKVDAINSQISVNGIVQKMGANLPKEVYFIVSIVGSRTPYVEIVQ